MQVYTSRKKWQPEFIKKVHVFWKNLEIIKHREVWTKILRDKQKENSTFRWKKIFFKVLTFFVLVFGIAPVTDVTH